MRKADFTAHLGTVDLTMPWGATVTARELTAADDYAIEVAAPRPRPPLKKVEGKGSLAKEEDPNDPAYLAAFDAWYSRRSVVRLAVGIGYEPEGFGPWDRRAPVDKRAAWMERAYDEITGSLRAEDIDRLHAAYTAVGQSATEGVGLGNSGPGPSPGET